MAFAAIFVAPVAVADASADRRDDFWGHRAEGGEARSGVPTSELPPPGKCRVWRSGVADKMQASPTNCDQAHRLAAKDSRAAVLHDDGRLRRSYQFSGSLGPDIGRVCHLDDPNAACVIDAISRSGELALPPKE